MRSSQTEISIYSFFPPEGFLPSAPSANMAVWKISLVTLVLCSILILPVVQSLAISSISVPYDAPLGTSIARIDTNGETVRLKHVDDASKVFRLSKGGILSLKYPLQTLLHKGRTGVMVVVQHDHGTRQWEELINVHISGVNNKLHFTENSPVATVMENSPSGTQVQGLDGLSVWRGDAQVVQVQLSGIGNELVTVKVSPDDGQVTMYTNEVLDREEVPFLDLRLTITGDGPIPETAESNIHIDVGDENDNRPEFFQIENEFSIALSSPPGTEAGSVRARDQDSGDNGEVSYFLITDSPFFDVNSRTGLIFVTSPIQEEGEYHLFLFAQDNGSPSLTSDRAAHVRVIVKPLSPEFIPYGNDIVYPVADQTVQFKQSRSKRDVRVVLIDVEENTPPDTIIGTITDYPRGTDTFFTNSTLFSVDQFTGNVTVMTDLNFENQNQHDFMVQIVNRSNTESVEKVQVTVKVLDASDPPFWTNSITPFVAVVPSDAPQNAPIYQLMADDEDANALLRFYLRTGEGFNIDEITGEIKTKPGFVYPASEDPYILSVYVEDINSISEDNSLRLMNGQVNVFVDRHPPQFTENPYNVMVSEGVPTQRVVTVQAISFDNQRLIYTLLPSLPGTPEHSIDEQTGTITLLNRLDREVLDNYYIEVEAREQRGQRQSSIVRINVKVEDTNDNAPEFEHLAFSFYDIPETIGTDEAIGSVKAVDPDEGENGMVYYSLSGEDASYFRVEPDGILYADQRLDYDLRYESYFFDVMATDGGSVPKSSEASVRVRVDPAFDESPVFAPASYTYYVDETAEAGYSIGTVYASDADLETITFSMEENSEGRFSVEPTTGVIMLARARDLPAAEYDVVVAATDTSGFKETANVKIFVNDVNDNAPIFDDCDTYAPVVKESETADRFVLQVSASDADRGSNAELSYRLLWDGSGENPFVIDSRSGVITLNFPPDRETNPSYRITVLAKDNAKDPSVGLCTFTITVEDENDSRPRFRRNQYEAIIPTTLGVGETVVTVQAEDPDLNSVITYGMEPSPYFRMDPISGDVIVKSALNALADQPWVGNIYANDTLRSSTETLTIRVLDSTDEAPVFDSFPRSITIPENFDTNQGHNNVSRVTARLSSAVTDGRITYTLLRGARPATNFPVKFLLINDETFSGATLIVSDSLDYETVQQIDLTIVAEGVIGSFPAQTTIQINLEDVNDNPPRFPLVDFDATVKEHAPIGTSVARVEADDADSTETFRRMRYSIDNPATSTDWQNFAIDPDTGEITTTVEFDREQTKTYLINVIAVNVVPLAEGTNLPNRAQTSVRIDVLDINDNNPQFEKALYTVSVREDAAVGSVVTEVTATDEDTDSTLRYLITSGNTNGVFEVDPDSGEISIAVGLDYEKVQTYTLEYSANDGLNTDSTIIIMNVTDINDKRPEFDQILYQAEVEEENPDNIPGVLLEVNAVDGDAALTPVEYSLEGTGANTIFTINRVTGAITINEVLDREEQASYILIAVAQDENGQGLKGYTTVEISVIDINDNEPRFPQVSYAGSVPEGSPRDTRVMEVVAEDMDDDQLRYSIVPRADDPLDGSGLFAIDSQTGVVTTQAEPDELDAETQNTYNILVNATDGRSFAITTATITVEDVNDNPPVFDPRSYSVTVPETLPIGDTAVEVSATDDDLMLRHEVSFEIVNGNIGDVFAIYTDTPTLRGLIYPQKVLDFERDPTSYNLEVEVGDGKFTDTASVSITVIDANEAPIFDPAMYETTVLENFPPLETIVTVTANDPDGISENGDFSYFVDPSTDPEGLFTMNENHLQVADGKELDRETVPVHNLIILATDEGTPPLSGSATVVVTLEDVDDTGPRFAEEYVGYVEENDTSIQWVAVVSAVDDDLIPQDPQFSYFIQLNQPGNEFFTGFENPGNNSFTVVTFGNKIFDREEIPEFNLVIDISDEGGNTAANVLPIQVKDKNDNPHHPVIKNMLVYAFEGTVPPPGAVPNIGIGYVGVNDKDILMDKTYTIESGQNKYININESTGLVEIAEGTPATDDGEPYILDVKVSDGGRYPDVVSRVIITIKEVPREAVFKSGSLRLSGVTPEEFISPSNGVSKMDRLKKLLATITGAKEDNIDIFTVLPVEGMDDTVDVRYSAHGSPYYSAERLNSAAEEDIPLIESTLDVTVEAIYIDECGSADCEDECSNVLNIDPVPVVINAVDASVVGINAFIAPFCGCAAREADVGSCFSHFCYNGGTCEDTFSGPRCTCDAGFTGPDCQGTTRSFQGKDYATFPPLQQCSDTRTSLEFITTSSSGVLLYNGPTSKSGPQDYILLQLSSGKPLLNMDLGSGPLTMEVTGSALLNDGKWHKVDIFRNGMDVELVIDDCMSAEVTEDHISSTVVNTDSCKVNGTLPEDDTVFDSNQPLQLGGVKPSLEYPSVLGLNSAEGFNGCIRNVDQDSTLYDLNDANEASSGSQPGCPDADRHCNDLTPPCINGVCEADFSGARCICNPGWFGQGCDQELDAYDFLDNSYVTYQLTRELPMRESHYKIMIRTRKQTGLIWEITNENTLEHVTMQLVGGYLMSSWHLGDARISVSLNKYPLDNGEWHSIFFYRFDNYIRIKVDGGGGVRQAENRDSSFRVLEVDRDSLLVGAELEYGVQVTTDFIGCIKDPRIGDNYLGVTERTEYANPTAVNVNEGCPSDACIDNTCMNPFVCVDIWRAYECRCPLGMSLVGGTCIDIADCERNPCQNGGTCIDKSADYECICRKGFVGKDCEVLQAPVRLTIGAGGILPIIGCLLLLLMLLLLFVVYKRTEDKKNALAFAVDPEDDIRENFINYDEEGGEKDQTAYDILTLRKPIEPSPIVPRSIKPVEDVPQRSIPRDGVNVGDFLEERLGDTDHDPSAPPYDTLHTYDYEGEGSTAGSISSLNSSSSDGSQDYDYLKELGPPFKRLADMYGGAE